jgi:hypothetical protein
LGTRQTVSNPAYLASGSIIALSMIPASPPIDPDAWLRATRDLPRREAELIAAQVDSVVPAGEGCDVLVATGVLPAGV